MTGDSRKCAIGPLAFFKRTLEAEMSSRRLAKISATLYRLIGGSLAEPTSPPCSCDRCELAWWQTQRADQPSARAKASARFGRASAG